MASELAGSGLPVRGPGPGSALARQTAGPGAGVEAFLAGQLSPATRRAYRGDFAAFIRFLGLRAGEDAAARLCAVDRETATAFRDKLMAEGYSPPSVARRLSVLSSVFEVLKEEGHVERNPFNRVKRPKVSNEGRTAALTKHQAEKLIHTPDKATRLGHRDFVLLALLFSCGLRRDEAVRVRVEHFKEVSGHMTLLVHGKGGTDMAVKVCPALWREIMAYVAKWQVTGYLFPAMSRNPKLNVPGKRLSTTGVWQVFKKHCRRAGLKADQLSPHSARATAITLALDGGASVRQVQAFARHADANTTLRYDRHRQNLDDNAADYVRLRLADGEGIPPDVAVTPKPEAVRKADSTDERRTP